MSKIYGIPVTTPICPSGTGGGSVTDKQIENAVSNYMAENPIDVGVKTVNGVYPDKNGNVDVAGGETGGVSSWNDLTDKPFCETVLYSWDEQNEYTEAVTIPEDMGAPGARFVKISDDAPDSSFFIGKTYVVTGVENGEPYTASFVMTEDAIYLMADTAYIAMNFYVFTDTTDLGGIVLTKGIWAMSDYTDVDGYLTSMKVLTVVPIDERYIPDTIARKGELPEHTWESLPDKPFGNEAVLYEYDKNNDYVDSYSVTKDDGSNVLCVKFGVMKYGEHPPESDYFIGKSVFVRAVSGDETEEERTNITSDIIMPEQNGVYMIGAGFICVVDTALYENGPIALSRGIWALIPDTIHVTNIRIYDEPQPLNERYIPDTIARIADVQVMIDAALGVIENGTY